MKGQQLAKQKIEGLAHTTIAADHRVPEHEGSLNSLGQ